MKLDSRELATVLAALRLWQQEIGEFHPDIKEEHLDIATDGGTLDELTVAEIDSICHRINVADDQPLLDNSELIVRARAMYQHTTDDKQLLIYDDAVIDPLPAGYWVEAYVWVSSPDQDKPDGELDSIDPDLGLDEETNDFENKVEADHVDNHGQQCPCCKSDEIEGGSMNFDAGTISQKVSCITCRATWWDVYNLVGLTEIRHGEAD